MELKQYVKIVRTVRFCSAIVGVIGMLCGIKDLFLLAILVYAFSFAYSTERLEKEVLKLKGEDIEKEEKDENEEER